MKKIPFDCYGTSDAKSLPHNFTQIVCMTCSHTRGEHWFTVTCKLDGTTKKANTCISCKCKEFTIETFESMIEEVCSLKGEG